MAKKKYAGGGFVGAAGTNQGSWSGAGGSLGVRTGTTTGTSASNRPEAKSGPSKAPGQIKKPAKAKPAGTPSPKKYTYEDMGPMFKKPGTGTNWPGQANRNPGAPGTANPEGKGDREMRRGGIVKKKMSAEERKEFKGGKYMGGPAEEKAEKKGKKTFGKKMADGGTARYGKNMGRPEERGSMPGVRMGQQGMRPGKRPGTVTNYPGIERPSTPPVLRPVPMPTPPPGMVGSAPRIQRPLPPIDTSKISAMRGGGLARKGVGQALAKGGLAKGAGCAQRGVHKPRMK